jgi:hypothetical protein
MGSEVRLIFADDGDALVCHAGNAATQMTTRTSSLNKRLRLMAF